MNIEDVPKQLELKFDYILEQLGKRNIFALLSTIGLEENVYDVCEILLQIQTKKRYEKNSSNFYNIYRIIKGVIEDSNISTETLSLILTKLNKKEKKETFDLVYYLLTEMKNILANPINQLIFKIIKSDSAENSNADAKLKKQKTTKAKKSNNKNKSESLKIKKEEEDFSNIEIFKIQSEKFLFLLKKLSNISYEYLVNFYSSLQLNENFTEAKIKGITHFEILSKLIKSKNSISIAENYEKAFNFFMNLVYKKNTRDIDKFKIFSALVKFNYKNAKERLKKSGLKKSTANIILKFLDEIKNEAIILLVLNFVKSKYLKGKKISNKIIQHLISKFSSLKNRKIYEALIQQNLEIIQKKLILTSSNFDLISNDFRRKIEKTSYFLKETLIKFSDFEENTEYTNIFEFNFMKFLIDTMQKLSIRKNFDYEGNLEAFIKIFYISSFDNRSYNILLKYFISCGEANKKMKRFLNSINSIRKSINKITLLSENDSEIDLNENNYFENNRFFDKQNLNVFDKIEILFHDRIKFNPDKPNESEPTAILIDDFSKEKLKSCFLNLFCFENSANYTLAKKLENLDFIISFAEDKLANSLKKIFLLKKFNNLNEKGSKAKSRMDIIDLIEKGNYSSDEAEAAEKEEKGASDNDSVNADESKSKKNSKNKNTLNEQNLELSHRFKFSSEDVIYIFKAFLFELETENISFLESLGDLFINEIEIKISKDKLNNNNSDLNQNVFNTDKDKVESFSQSHLLSLLKSILTTYYFFIKNISVSLKAENNKQNNLLNETEISRASNLNTNNNTLNKSNLNQEGKINQIDINVNDSILINHENNNSNKLAISVNFLNQNYLSKMRIEDSNDLTACIKKHLLSIFHFLKKILINNINQEDIVNLIIIISKNLYGLEEENIRINILNFVKRELTNFCFESSENSIKSLADFFLKINKGEFFYYIPERFEYYLKSENHILTSLKFINYLIKLEFENQELLQKLKSSSLAHQNFNNDNNGLEKLRSLIFKEDIIEYLTNDLTKYLISLDFKNEILFVDIHNVQKRNALGNKLKRMITLKNEIYKLYMHYIIFLESNPKKKEEDDVVMTEEKSQNNKENDSNKIHNLKKFTKGIFSNIHELLDTENLLFNVKNNKLIINENSQIDLYSSESLILNNEISESSNDEAENDSNSEFINISKLDIKDFDAIKKHKITESVLLIKNNFINQFRIMELCKNISLVFLMVDFKHNIDLKDQVRLSNLALNRELLVRSYLLKKIEKILLRKNSIYQYLNIIQILILYLNEPNKDLNKKGLDIFGKFINFICKKFNQYKHLINCESKSYFYYYKYIPETYITYLIMYIVFNPNLITLAQLYEKKYFQDLIKKFLKIINKSTNGAYDSSFMLGILIQIKDLELINSKNKFISLLSTFSNNTYLDTNIAKGKVSVFNQISNNLKSRIAEFNFESYNQTKNSVCDLAMDIIKLNFDTKIKNENVKPLIPVIFYTKEFINKNNMSFNLNNFNLFNILNNTNNFTFLNGLNAEAHTNANNITNTNLFGNLDVHDDESKGKSDYNKNAIKNNRFTLENFVKKNDNSNSNNNNKNKFNLNNLRNKVKNNDEEQKDGDPKIQKNGLNKNLRKKVKSEIEKEVESDHEKAESEDIGNFDVQEKPNRKVDKNKKKTKVKNAPLKFYVDEEPNDLNLEKKREAAENEHSEESADELEILPYYNKYKNKQKYKGVIADQESYNYHNIENSQEENENDDLSSEEDSGNFKIGEGRNTKRGNKAKNKGKKKAVKEEKLIVKDKKKKKGK